MPLVKDNRLIEDPFVDARTREPPPCDVPVIVTLEQWQTHRQLLMAGGQPLGIWLRSDQHPSSIADDIARFAAIALEFPVFRDGRAHSYARLLRERYAFQGELRAVGEVLIDQLHFMLRNGFDAFEIKHSDPLGAFRKAAGQFSVWYQPTGDAHATAMELRQRQ